MACSRGVMVAVVALCVASLTLAGCGGKPEVTSPWPVANAERTVPKPTEPLRWPLTGLPAPDQAAITKRPFSIKIENSPQARPQSGLNSADVVYETVTEGGITRFNCIFQSTVPQLVGPVRSARLSDTWIVPQYNALFFYSGASNSVNSAVKSAKLPNLSQDAGVAAPYTRSSQRSAPHNLYLDSKKAYAEAMKRGMPVSVKVLRLQHAPKSAESSNAVSSVTIPFSTANTAEWTYDSSRKVYLRKNNGKVHSDGVTSKQVAAKNVVVMWVKYTRVGRDKVGSTTYRVELGGSGRASVFRDGKRYDGTWTATRTSPPRFKASNGETIRLAPGNTWFQVVSLNTNISMR